MKLAIMQPYYFPYIGYWQLMYAADRFVIYDDVNYIKGGWINRNRILINGKPTYITVPLHQASQYKLICETALHSSPAWHDKLVKMVEMSYRKAPEFDRVFPMIEKIIRHETTNLSEYLAYQLRTLSQHMGITTEIVVTSRCYDNNGLSGQERILDICKREYASTYINPSGGQSLYDPDTFRDAGIDLHFIVMHPMTYKQRTKGFVPYLSIIDALMEIKPSEIRRHIDAFDLITCEKRHAH